MHGYPMKIESSAAAKDPEMAKRLWQVSEEFTAIHCACCHFLDISNSPLYWTARLGVQSSVTGVAEGTPLVFVFFLFTGIRLFFPSSII